MLVSDCIPLCVEAMSASCLGMVTLFCMALLALLGICILHLDVKVAVVTGRNVNTGADVCHAGTKGIERSASHARDEKQTGNYSVVTNEL